MAFLDSVKEYLYKKDLDKTIHSTLNYKRGMTGKGKVKSISILYAESGPFDLEKIENHIQKLKNAQLEVHHLKLSQKHFPKGQKPENEFSSKEISLSGFPKNPLFEKFNKQESDLFYNLLDPEMKLSGFMNLLNKSKIRIGLKTSKQTGCDLMINLKDYNFNDFIKTSDDILEKMNINKHDKSII